MTRAKERGEGFRVAQVQQKRADRADERIAELRRELQAAHRELKVVGEDLALERECSAALTRDLQLAKAAVKVQQAVIAVYEAEAAKPRGLFAGLRARIARGKPC